MHSIPLNMPAKPEHREASTAFLAQFRKLLQCLPPTGGILSAKNQIGQQNHSCINQVNIY